MRTAAIDLGTNTVRLLVGEADGRGAWREVFADQESTRLGEGLLPERRLRPLPAARTLAALSRFARAAAAHGAERIAAAATSAVREAVNQEEFLAAAREEAGLAIRVLSGEEEARLTLRGVRGGLPACPERMLLLDIGGGSTELLLAEGAAVRAAVSTGLGAVGLTEAHLVSDPPAAEELAAAAAAVRARVARFLTEELAGGARPESLVGTAGTLTTLAAIDLGLAVYDPARIAGHRLSRSRIGALVAGLAAQPLAARRRVVGLEPARADILPAGGLICLGVMEGLGFDRLTVSDAGLREGLLLEALGGAGARRET